MGQCQTHEFIKECLNGFFLVCFLEQEVNNDA